MNPLPRFPKLLPVPALRRRVDLLATGGTTFFGALLMTSMAIAQTTAPAGGIGEQLNLMSGEAISAGGTGANMAMYGAALITFILGVWSIWKSRQPQNREGGHLAMGIAGLVLCGLFASGPTWIGKAAMTTGGTAATVSNAATVVKF